MKFLSGILTFSFLFVVFTSSATTNSLLTNLTTEEGEKEKKEMTSKDGDSKENTDENKDKDKELIAPAFELKSEMVNKAKPAQLELENTTSNLLDLDIDDKIELAPKLN